jgi:hypothetical protein
MDAEPQHPYALLKLTDFRFNDSINALHYRKKPVVCRPK